MDPQFEELASRLTKDISFKVDEAVSAAEERLDLRFSRRLDEAKNELTQHARSNLEELKQHARFDLEELKQHAQSNLEELKHQAQLNQEELKERIAMAADGFAGALESIKRQAGPAPLEGRH